MTLVRQVLEDGKQWWKLRNRSGQAGYVPSNILDVVKTDEVDSVFTQVSDAALRSVAAYHNINIPGSFVPSQAAKIQ